MLEVITENKHEEYEKFVSTHHKGSFYQSLKWTKVKNNWNYEALVSRDQDGKIVGSMLILIQKIPYFNSSFLYSPRGPVCDIYNRLVFSDLISGVRLLAEKYNAHIFKIDPNILASDNKLIEIINTNGFTLNKGGENFETIQPRFNYRLYFNGRSLDELLSNLHSKTRYNIRVSQKHGVQIKICDKDYLDDFMTIMKVTGERDGFNTRSKEYFERILDAFDKDVRLYIAFYKELAIAGAITVNYAGQSSYVYGASDNKYRNVMPNYLLQWEMIKWAVETKCYVYDFQGVSGNITDEKNPLYGLYRFKKGFNGVLDELAGEFDIVFKPLRNNLISIAMDIKENLNSFFRK